MPTLCSATEIKVRSSIWAKAREIGRNRLAAGSGGMGVKPSGCQRRTLRGDFRIRDSTAYSPGTHPHRPLGSAPHVLRHFAAHHAELGVVETLGPRAAGHGRVAGRRRGGGGRCHSERRRQCSGCSRRHRFGTRRRRALELRSRRDRLCARAPGWSAAGGGGGFWTRRRHAASMRPRSGLPGA